MERSNENFNFDEKLSNFEEKIVIALHRAQIEHETTTNHSQILQEQRAALTEELKTLRTEIAIKEANFNAAKQFLQLRTENYQHLKSINILLRDKVNDEWQKLENKTAKRLQRKQFQDANVKKYSEILEQRRQQPHMQPWIQKLDEQKNVMEANKHLIAELEMKLKEKPEGIRQQFHQIRRMQDKCIELDKTATELQLEIQHLQKQIPHTSSQQHFQHETIPSSSTNNVNEFIKADPTYQKKADIHDIAAVRGDPPFDESPIFETMIRSKPYDSSFDSNETINISSSSNSDSALKELTRSSQENSALHLLDSLKLSQQSNKSQQMDNASQQSKTRASQKMDIEFSQQSKTGFSEKMDIELSQQLSTSQQSKTRSSQEMDIALIQDFEVSHHLKRKSSQEMESTLSKQSKESPQLDSKLLRHAPHHIDTAMPQPLPTNLPRGLTQSQTKEINLHSEHLQQPKQQQEEESNDTFYLGGSFQEEIVEPSSSSTQQSGDTNYAKSSQHNRAPTPPLIVLSDDNETNAIEPQQQDANPPTFNFGTQNDLSPFNLPSFSANIRSVQSPKPVTTTVTAKEDSNSSLDPLFNFFNDSHSMPEKAPTFLF